ncbi:MAG: hypothetical protein KF893_24335 [Caldilineaceae bacterium]|nr:hypothetical protein [Caldilineaceae bacterium]
MAEPTVNRKQREALEAMVQLLTSAEQNALVEQHSHAYSLLELPTYQQLVGIEENLAELEALLTSSAPPWVIVLQGMGGLGKTALADQIMRRAIEDRLFDGFGWVSVRQSIFALDGTIHAVNNPIRTAEHVIEQLARQIVQGPLPVPYQTEKALSLLQQQLERQRYLITIDNLESLADIEVLIPYLSRLVQPSKFLLTSRQSLPDAPQVFPQQVQPLGQQDALQLVRIEAESRNLPALAAATDEHLLPIYTLVGGNPLALRLVVGQTHRHPLMTVLDDLRIARGQAVDHLYTFVYRRAWETLTQRERQAFLSMPLTPPQGADFSYLHSVSGLDEVMLHDALETLISLNLVEHRTGLFESRYSIHSLTRTFLLEQIVRWQR